MGDDYRKYDELVDTMTEAEAKAALKKEARMRGELAKRLVNGDSEQTEGKLRLLSMVGN